MASKTRSRDMTERKTDETSLKLFRALLDKAGDAIEVIDPKTLRYLDVNEAACRMYGYNRDELLTMGVPDIHVNMDALPVQKINEDLQARQPVIIEALHRRKDGSTFPVEVSISQVQIDREYNIAVARNISERKKAEESQALFRSLLNNSNDAIEMIEPGTLRFLNINDTGCRQLGYSREELLAMTVHDIDTMSAEQNKAIEKQIMKSGVARFETAHRRKDGSTFPVEVSVNLIKLDRSYLLGIARDISERRQGEQELRRTNRALKLLSRCNIVLVRAEEEQAFLKEICRLAVETGGYMMAWVGMAEHNTEKTVRPIAQSGYEEGYLDTVTISWADTELGRGPTGTAIRTGKTEVNPNCLNNPKMAPWRDAVVKRGYQSSIALPLIYRNRILGALTIYAAGPYAFYEEEVVLLEELANEISYGIETIRTRIKHEEQGALLRQSLVQSIQAIADTVEARDPYTAGHQRGVADLAMAIAREMQLTEEQIHGIRLASIIHDLGKIHIPAEILSKPGRLSDIEMQLIRVHPQAGYDIIKGIEFPWPIADMILQHHERLDGSGYPQGLKGEQILSESRIIAVADVVEAMSSHRPYREGRGLDAALEEIEHHRGILYDAEAVDACLRLFREHRYEPSNGATLHRI